VCPDVLLFRLWSPARERRIYRTQTQANAYVMRLLRYKASPSRCDDRRTSRSLSGATRHTLFGRLDLARVRGHVELAWAEAGDDVTVYPPFAVAILHVSKVCAAVALLCTVQESSIRGRRAAVKSEGQGYLERGRTC